MNEDISTQEQTGCTGWLAMATSTMVPHMFRSVPYRLVTARGLLRVVLAVQNGMQEGKKWGLWQNNSRQSKTAKRNDLTLGHKYEVIKTAEKEKQLGVYSEMFGCGETGCNVTGFVPQKLLSRPYTKCTLHVVAHTPHVVTPYTTCYFKDSLLVDVHCTQYR